LGLPGDDLQAFALRDARRLLIVFADQPQLAIRIALGQRHKRAADAFVERHERREGLGAQANEDFAPVRRVALARDERSPLEAIEDMRDRAGGQSGVLGEPAGGDAIRRAARNEVDALRVGGVEADALGNGLMQEDGLGADHPAELPQPGEKLFARCHRIPAIIRHCKYKETI
jgi:hypothetical protein